MIRSFVIGFLLLQAPTVAVTSEGYRAAPVTSTLVWTNHQGLSAPFAACYVAVDTGGAVTLIDLPDDRCTSLQ